MRSGLKQPGHDVVPYGWELVQLGEVSDINPSKPKSLADDTQVSFVGMTDVSEEAQLKTHHTRDYKSVSKGFTTFLDGDVLIAKITPCFENGKGALVYGLTNGIGFGSTEFHVVRAQNQILPEYLYYHTVSHTFRQIGANHMIGSSGQKRVTKDFISSYTILLPSLPEQRKIAEILSTVDGKMSVIDEQLAQTQELKNGLLQYLLTRGIGHTSFKDSPLGEIPEGWEVNLLDSVAKRGSGHTPSKSFPEYYGGEIKWISLGDSHRLDNGWIKDTKTSISTLGIKNSSAVLHPKGTVLLSRDAGVGKSAVMHEAMAVSQHFMTWTCGPQLDNWFLYYFLQLNKPYFERIAAGSTIKTIGLAVFKKLVVPIPPINEQERIAKTLSTVDDKLQVLSDKKAQYQNLKHGLMQQLLTGKLRVKHTQKV